jgi:hypothetical protein
LLDAGDLHEIPLFAQHLLGPLALVYVLDIVATIFLIPELKGKELGQPFRNRIKEGLPTIRPECHVKATQEILRLLPGLDQPLPPATFGIAQTTVIEMLKAERISRALFHDCFRAGDSGAL